MQRFSPAGAFLGRVGSGPGSGPGQFSHPRYVAVDCRGTLYVADVDNNRIQRLGEPGVAPCGDPAHDPAERLVVTATARASQRFRTTFAVAVGVACDRPCTATVARHRQGRRAQARAARSRPIQAARRDQGPHRESRSGRARHRSHPGRAAPAPQGRGHVARGRRRPARAAHHGHAPRAPALAAIYLDATVTWIAPGSRTHAIMPRAVRRSSTNWKASAWARLR